MPSRPFGDDSSGHDSSKRHAGSSNPKDFAKGHVVPVVALEANAHVTHAIAQAIFVGCIQAPGEGRWEVPPVPLSSL